MFLQKILPNIKTQKSYLKVFESGSDIVRGIWCGITKIDPVPVSSGQSVEVIVKMATEKSMKVLPQQFNSIFLHLLKVLFMDGIVQPAENPIKYLMLDAPSPPAWSHLLSATSQRETLATPSGGLTRGP